MLSECRGRCRSGVDVLRLGEEFCAGDVDKEPGEGSNEKL